MNERMIELANKANEDIGYTFKLEDAKQLHELMEKFAELIARECAELSVNSQYTNTKSEYYEGFNEALIYSGNKIRKHFGVEE